MLKLEIMHLKIYKNAVSDYCRQSIYIYFEKFILSYSHIIREYRSIFMENYSPKI
jgi:hypothetical protein